MTTFSLCPCKREGPRGCHQEAHRAPGSLAWAREMGRQRWKYKYLIISFFFREYADLSIYRVAQVGKEVVTVGLRQAV